ncbi:MAG: TonB-dependent receptor [Chlorobi bacterium]|nr:MAG: TonB-dependent receptor [Chlorobi bacterium OLB7]MBK8910515.1 TonB-dependent receptor [Chlorobiota bacterium]MBX7216918.1 TonB-dependent receptor [Candidatus Kapabacteria bacterium]
MQKKFPLLLLPFCLIITTAYGQQPQDTTRRASKLDTSQVLKKREVTVTGERIPEVGRLDPIKGTYIYAGKKNEVIQLTNTGSNIAEKTGRQVFAKVPGIFVYDMDGSGNQINISTRGLDPHRGWEFNLRKDGVITNSDMYGYPASHFSMPLESIERIELVRGTGSLEYGAQFGGMVNYITKKPDTTKEISSEIISTIGSFGLYSNYISVGGKIGKTTYNAYGSRRGSDGYRDNSRTISDAEQITLSHEFSANATLQAEISRSYYLFQIPGPLTDSMFHQNPRMSTRSRNYFNPEIYIPSLSFNWKFNEHSELYLLASAVLGDRNSIQYDKPANIRDSINAATLSFNSRQVDIDNFNSYTAEARFRHQYELFDLYSTVVAGAQYMNNDLHRRQLGKGSTGSDFDLELTDPNFGRDLHFKTNNVALFIENNFKLSDALSINAGIRTEYGTSQMTGLISYLPENEVPNTIDHKFSLFGGSIEYAVADQSNIYAGFSQAYRPVIFKDIIPASTYERVDKNLQDADGYNLDLGFRGKWDIFRWDASVFQVQYNNRLGTLSESDSSGGFYLYRTNIGNSYTNGVELFVEANIKISSGLSTSIFSSTSYMNARYQDASVKSGNANINVTGNKVETVPELITRNGLTLKIGDVNFSMLYSYVGESYADALNTGTPSATGSVGVVPSYGLLDINATFRVNDMLNIRANINNVTDKQYFTKRPSFYPGPGVWSSDGRSFSVTAAVQL